IVYKSITYTSYKRMHDYPYLILTGTNFQHFYREIFYLILPKLGEYGILGILFALVHYLTLSRKAKVTYEYEKSREVFLKTFRRRNNETFDFILAHNDLIHKFLSGDINVGVDYHKCIKLTENIHQAVFDLKNSIPRIITYKYLDANAAIKDCLKILIPLASRKQVLLFKDKSLDLPLPSLCVDELSFKQIIIGLVALSIQFTPKGGRIKISAEITKYAADTSSELTTYDREEFLCLRIEDTGIPLTNTDIQRLAKRFDQEEEYWCFGGTDLTLEAIEKLVKLHNGTFHIETKGSIGKSTKLLIPYSLQPTNLETGNNPGDRGVVINFPGKVC
ncbi:MAG TPA: ATP-binding protein, partial [Candidatus Nitrosotenuis sp.]|nr:ATP-binding protein [Candidatus Nitrosotenuis sp.]